MSSLVNLCSCGRRWWKSSGKSGLQSRREDVSKFMSTRFRLRRWKEFLWTNFCKGKTRKLVESLHLKTQMWMWFTFHHSRWRLMSLGTIWKFLKSVTWKEPLRGWTSLCLRTLKNSQIIFLSRKFFCTHQRLYKGSKVWSKESKPTLFQGVSLQMI